jgi:hypothetical protein
MEKSSVKFRIKKGSLGGGIFLGEEEGRKETGEVPSAAASSYSFFRLKLG